MRTSMTSASGRVTRPASSPADMPTPVVSNRRSDEDARPEYGDPTLKDATGGAGSVDAHAPTHSNARIAARRIAPDATPAIRAQQWCSSPANGRFPGCQMSAPTEARKHLADAHRIVVKVGTHVVTHDGVDLALGRIMEIVEGLARLRQAGREIVLVSSGAVGMGMRVLGLKERPRSLGNRQACAAVGQGHLMSLYTDAFARFDVVAAQVLLTQEDLADRDRALNLRTTLMRLLELGAIPVLNENDSVSIAELVEHRRAQSGAPDTAPAGFGDNDGLSARVAVSLDADLLVLLTNVGGLYTANPRVDASAQRISELADVDDAARARADGV